MVLVVMILRVWALYKQSRVIFGVLLTFYSVEVIVYLASRVIFTTEKNEGMSFKVLCYAHYI